MKRISIILIFLINFIYSIQGICSPIQEWWLKTIVLIEQETKNEKGQSQTTPVGTGFLLESEKGNFYIVTCKHVVKNKDGSNKGGLFYRLNTKPSINDPFDRIPIDSLLKETKGDYFLHSNENVDLVIFPVGVNPERDDVQFITLSKFEEFDKIDVGENIFVLGYPIGIISSGRNQPIVRNGIVAFKNKDFICLIDSASFPGNSGSPVIIESFPYTYDKEKFNRTEIKQSRIIGIISREIYYSEPAISPQTGNIRVTFEQNSGLSTIVTCNFIKDILKSEPLRNYEEKEEQKGKTTPNIVPR